MKDDEIDLPIEDIKILDSITIEDEQQDTFKQHFKEQVEILTDLDSLTDPEAIPDREYWQPKESEDKFGAFLTRCEICTSDQGLISGLEIGVKDNIAVAGIPMTAGSPILEEYIPSKDATSIQRILKSGGKIVGKTNLDEFAMGHDDSTMRFRIARNPLDDERLPGGSSVGSAVAVADGLVDVALGSDTGGSIRLPASWCGIIGFKPTRGLVSHHGFVQYAKTLDTIGVMGSELPSIADTLQAIAGTDPRDSLTSDARVGDYRSAVLRGREKRSSKFKIGFTNEMFGHDDKIDGEINEILDKLERFGTTIREVAIDYFEYSLPAWLAISITEFGAYVTSRFNNYWRISSGAPHITEEIHKRLKTDADLLGDPVIEQLLKYHYLRDTCGDKFYARGQRARAKITSSIDNIFSIADAIICPTIPMVAPTVDEGLGDVNKLTANTRPFSLSGHPAISVPIGEINGLPVGLQIIGARFDEETVFQVAAHVNQILKE